MPLPFFIPPERMFCQRQFRQRMIISHQSDWLGMTDLADRLDARTRLADTETVTRENLPVALRMELGETLGELELTTVNGQCPISALLPLHGILR